jgi:hypothetical protein
MDEDMLAKRSGIEDKVSSRDTSSDTSKGLGNKVDTPWMLHSFTTLEEYEAQSSGAMIRGKNGMQSGSAPIGLEDRVHICGVHIR